MAELTQSEFLREQQKALERMKEMQRRSQLNDTSFNMPPAPSFVKLQNESEKKSAEPKSYEKAQDNKKSLLDLTLIDKYLKDPDSLIILALILILYSEKSDKYLLFSLMYILL